MLICDTWNRWGLLDIYLTLILLVGVNVNYEHGNAWVTGPTLGANQAFHASVATDCRLRTGHGC